MDARDGLTRNWTLILQNPHTGSHFGIQSSLTRLGKRLVGAGERCCHIRTLTRVQPRLPAAFSILRPHCQSSQLRFFLSQPSRVRACSSLYFLSPTSNYVGEVSIPAAAVQSSCTSLCSSAINHVLGFLAPDLADFPDRAHPALAGFTIIIGSWSDTR